MVTDELITAAENLEIMLKKLGIMLEKEGLDDCVYNPLIYAWEPHKAFIELGGGKGAKNTPSGDEPWTPAWNGSNGHSILCNKRC